MVRSLEPLTAVGSCRFEGASVLAGALVCELDAMSVLQTRSAVFRAETRLPAWYLSGVGPMW